MNTFVASLMTTVPKTMRAVFQTTAGAPQDVLQVGSLPVPEPKGRQLLVKVFGASMNPVDYKISDSLAFREADGSPVVVGWDASGVVVGLGPDVKLHKEGDAVMFSGDVRLNGHHSEYAVIDERLAGRKPARLTHVQAGVVPLTALTAWEGLLENMAIPRAAHSDKSILVVGASGGVGGMVTQIAKKVCGLTVIGTASREDTVTFAKTMGADYVINHRKPFAKEFAEQDLKHVDYVFNTADAGANFGEIASVLNPLAKWVNILEPSKPLELNAIMPLRVQFSFEFMFSRSFYGVDEAKQRAILNEVADLLDEGVLQTTLTTEMDLFTDYVDAHKKQRSGTMIGKLGLVVATE